jgi:hypothetical protein
MPSKPSSVKPSDESYSEKETVKRRDEWLRRSLKTPPKRHADMVAERKTSRSAKDKGKTK